MSANHDGRPGWHAPAEKTAAQPPSTAPDATPGDAPSAQSLDRRRARRVHLAVALCAVAAGAFGSSVYNNGFRARAADDSAIIRTGADPSVFLNPPADRHSVVLPVTNNSPNAVTVIGLTVPQADAITWNHDQITIAAGQTAAVVVITPGSCPVTVLPQLTPPPAQVYLRVNTVNGKPHGITLNYTGVMAYAAVECRMASGVG